MINCNFDIPVCTYPIIDHFTSQSTSHDSLDDVEKLQQLQLDSQFQPSSFCCLQTSSNYKCPFYQIQQETNNKTPVSALQQCGALLTEKKTGGLITYSKLAKNWWNQSSSILQFYTRTAAYQNELAINNLR